MKTIVLVVVAILAVPAVTSAQARHSHRGYWISFGGGGGVTNGDRGASFYLRMGGTPHPRVQFGGQILTWQRERVAGGDVGQASVTATASIYPLYRSSGEPSLFREWFVRVGFGVAGKEIAGTDAEGVSTNLGTGFNFRLGGNFFVTTNLDFLLNFFETRTDTSLLFTLGFSWN